MSRNIHGSIIWINTLKITRYLFWSPLFDSLSASISFNRTLICSLDFLVRFAHIHVWLSTDIARYFASPPLRLISRDIVEGERFKVFAIALIDKLAYKPRDISSRSSKVNARFERVDLTGFIPPYFCRKQKNGTRMLIKLSSDFIKRFYLRP